MYSTETRVALVKERVRAKERQRQMRLYAAGLVLAALAAGVMLAFAAIAALIPVRAKEEV